MKFVKRIFSINTLIVVFAFTVVPLFAINQVKQLFIDMKDLDKHSGVVEHVYLMNEWQGREDSIIVAKVKLFADTTEYTASERAEAVVNMIATGDTVELFTRKITSDMGNMVADENSGSIFTTHNPNEIFHFHSPKYDTPIIDFNRRKSILLKSLWIYPVVFIILIGWYLYRRSGIKSPFVSESFHYH